jgi:hypothetical protein
MSGSDSISMKTVSSTTSSLKQLSSTTYEVGGCPSACRAACLLIIGASGGAGCANAAAATQAPLVVLQLLSSIAQTRERAGGWLSHRSGVGITAWSAAFEALLALAGLEFHLAPHVGAAARALTHGEGAAAVDAADAVLRDACAAADVLHLCVATAVQWTAAAQVPDSQLVLSTCRARVPEKRSRTLPRHRAVISDRNRAPARSSHIMRTS